MALFRRKPEPGQAPQGPRDHRSKRGGVRRTTTSFKLDELAKLATPPAPAPPAAPPQATPKASTRRIVPPKARPAGALPRAAAPTRRTTRLSRRGTPIGDLLIQASAINTEQLTRALRIQEQKGGLLGQTLVEMGACTRSDIAAALSKQFRFTQVSLAGVEGDPNALVLIPPEKCLEMKLVPFEQLGQLLCVAMVNVLNKKAVKVAGDLSKLKVKAFTTTWAEIQQATTRYYTPEVREAIAEVEEARKAGTSLAEVVQRVVRGLAAKKAAAPTQEVASRRREAAKTLKAEVRGAPSAEIEVRRYIKAAEDLKAKGKLEEAVKRIQVGLREFPEEEELTSALEKFKKELEELREAESRRLSRVAELLAKGREDRAAGRLEEAAAKFQEAAELDPQNNVVRKELSLVQKEVVKREAEETARRKAEEEARAAETRRKAEEEARRNAQIAELLALAKAAFGASRFGEAESRYKDVLALDSGNQTAFKGLESVKDAVEAKRTEEEREREEAIEAALKAAAEDRDASQYEQATAGLEEALRSLGEDERLLEALQQVRLREKEEAAARRRQEEEAAELRTEIDSLVEQAAAARRDRLLDDAERMLEDALALDPENAEIAARLGEVREELKEKLDEEEARRRAEEAKARREETTREMLREAEEDRLAGRLELALRKLNEIAAEEPDREDVREAIRAAEADAEQKKQDEEERLRKEEEARRKAEEELRHRAAAAAEAQVDRRRTEAGVAGEKRIQIGLVREDNLVAFEKSPEIWRMRLAEIIGDGGAESPEKSLDKLPVAQVYAKNKQALRDMLAAAEAVEHISEEVVIPMPEEAGLELEPALEPQAPMPDLEAQLAAEPEAILEAVPEEEAEGEVVLEAVPEVAAVELQAAVPISEEDFARLQPELEPDPVQEWLEMYTAAGPIPASPLEN